MSCCLLIVHRACQQSDPAWLPLPKASWKTLSQGASWATAQVGTRTFYVPENARNPQNNPHPEASLS